MLRVYADTKDLLIFLRKDKLGRTIVLKIDQAKQLVRDLSEAIENVKLAAVSGYKLVTKLEAKNIWEARIGFYEDVVAVEFSIASYEVPLPPAVAEKLVERLQSVIAAAESRIVVKSVNGDPVDTFFVRPTRA
jgi:hypothetical protein